MSAFIKINKEVTARMQRLQKQEQEWESTAKSSRIQARRAVLEMVNLGSMSQLLPLSDVSSQFSEETAQTVMIKSSRVSELFPCFTEGLGDITPIDADPNSQYSDSTALFTLEDNEPIPTLTKKANKSSVKGSSTWRIHRSTARLDAGSISPILSRRPIGAVAKPEPVNVRTPRRVVRHSTNPSRKSYGGSTLGPIQKPPNIRVIKSALSEVWIPGTKNRVARDEIFNLLDSKPTSNYILLFKDESVRRDVRGLYECFMESLVRIWGRGPETIQEPQIQVYFRYDPVAKDFSKVPCSSMAMAIDAVKLHIEYENRKILKQMVETYPDESQTKAAQISTITPQFVLQAALIPNQSMTMSQSARFSSQFLVDLQPPPSKGYQKQLGTIYSINNDTTIDIRFNETPEHVLANVQPAAFVQYNEQFCKLGQTVSIIHDADSQVISLYHGEQCCYERDPVVLDRKQQEYFVIHKNDSPEEYYKVPNGMLRIESNGVALDTPKFLRCIKPGKQEAFLCYVDGHPQELKVILQLQGPFQAQVTTVQGSDLVLSYNGQDHVTSNCVVTNEAQNQLSQEELNEAPGCMVHVYMLDNKLTLAVVQESPEKSTAVQVTAINAQGITVTYEDQSVSVQKAQCIDPITGVQVEDKVYKMLLKQGQVNLITKGKKVVRASPIN